MRSNLDTHEYIVEMHRIRKTFPGIIANDDITLQVRKQSIHALLGENGSGKTTLMSILFGLLKSERGEIYIKGKKVQIANSLIAGRLGIGMVHQHFQLIDTFTVTQNIILGIEPKKTFNRIYLADAEKKIRELSERYKLYVDPDALVRDIPVSMQQRVEILKMLYRNAELMIFDEPTAVLVPSEIEELIKIMKTLVSQGRSIILITHKLQEIMQVAEYCTVLRRGKNIGTVKVSETRSESLAQMMVGRPLQEEVHKKNVENNETVLEIRDLTINGASKVTVVDKVNLTVRRGEILGLAGVEGNGQIELVEALIGIREIDSGELFFKNKNITHLTIKQRIQLGIGTIPEDRQKQGLIPDFSLAENIILKKYNILPFAKNGILQNKQINALGEELIHDFDIRSNQGTRSRMGSMSGGNQQKVIIAREIDYSPVLLLVVQPTRGLDVGAIEYIHERLVAERNKGRAILLISMELDEIIKLSDRIAVMYNGRIVDVFPSKNIDPVALGCEMIGEKVN